MMSMQAFERRQSDLSVDISEQLQTSAQALLEQVVADLDPRWGGGAMTPVAYDTAWVAMVRLPDKPDALAFPQAFSWLLAHQAADGSWGAGLPYTVLPTIAGLLALVQAPTSYQSEHTRRAAQKAEAYLRYALSNWSIAEHESVAFEVLAPCLLELLADHGIDFDFAERDALLKLYAEKFRIAGPNLIYTGQSNLIHSLEAFGSHIDFAALAPLQAGNGGYGCSPAATAAALIYGPAWDEKAAAWLAHLCQRSLGGKAGGMPNAYPIDAFEGAWVLYNLVWGGFTPYQDLPSGEVEQLTAWLHGCVRSDGASITHFVGMPTDSDDTGMVLAALNKAGVLTSVDTLLPFERASHFACFARERGASVSANAHVLAALTSLPYRYRQTLLPQINKTIAFLEDVREPGGYWKDKWHISPLYATACVLLALDGYDTTRTSELWRPATNWVLQSQLADGGWGAQGQSTLEETAYALQILLTLPTALRIDYAVRYEQAISSGMSYLAEHFESVCSETYDFPPLWRGKELYAPPRVIRSAVIAVLGRYKRDFTA